MKKILKAIYNHTLYPLKRSIQAKISAGFIVIVAVTVSIIVLIGYINVSSIIRNRTSQYLTESVYKANENLEMILSDLDRLNTIVSINEPILLGLLEGKNNSPSLEWFNNVKSLSNHLSSLANSREKIVRGIAVIGMNGEVFTGGNPLVYHNMLDETWAKKIIDAKGRSMLLKRDMGLKNDALKDEYVLTIGRAVMRYGQVKGMVLVDMNFEVISSFFKLNDISIAGLFVINDEGEVIYKYAEDNTLKSMEEEQSSKIIQAEGANTKPWINEKYLTINYKSNYTGWTTLVMVSKDFLLKDFISLRDEMALAIIPILILSLILGLIIANQITKNLKKLKGTMELVKGGDLKATPDIKSEDEVGELSQIYSEMMGEIHGLMDNIKSTEKQKRLAELNVLQTQVNPHFLCNTLNTIKYLAHLQNTPNIHDVTVSLIRLLRITIDNKERLITVREEIELVKSYITIQKYKLVDKFSVVFSVEDEVLQLKTIKMLLQPLVENAIIHGIEPSDHDGVISIKIYKEDERVKFRVMDNGVGMAPEKIGEIMNGNVETRKSKFNGIGFKNVNERIKMFFGEEYGLKIYSQPGMYTTVEIEIPVIQD